MTPKFLTRKHVRTIHERVVDEFGGDSSIRDHALLESALSVPSSSFDGEYLHDSISAMGAAYLFHICRNHPFIDGNEWTALASAEVFLLLNGKNLDATEDEVVELTMGVADGSTSKGEVVAFFESSVTDSATDSPG